MIIDFHTYVGTSMLGQESTEDELLQNMAENQVDISVICPVKTTDPFFERQNEYVSDLQRKHAGKLAGFCRIDPNLGKDSEKILRESVQELELKGLVLHPWEETFAINDKKVYPFMEICREYGLPVLVETGYPWLSHCFQVADLAERFPEITFIMSHGGQFDSSGYALTDVDHVMDRHSNLMIETSGDYSDEGIENIPERLGYDRLVFGSHFPWLNTELEIYRIQRADLTDEARESIFYKNALRLLK
ncbi:amidohydrolase family protein [[Clostridium] hylemonae]|uniref:Amidohydrolase family protein n=1 Tax=[Clostridium] hylemonae DSM 15053 TaxID=553973 RepID=C0C176_9FIRM|nr:amidohydrolase family protein [[Clostridium] hylemonae]EEG73890.1 amidohydrolase family protein [[Clostridium] hylemonae DSM 15053]QEK19282.1 hypothetical protein LAJLEIBI_03314 [[Clostridium] hylemonae DSM 15053]